MIVTLIFILPHSKNPLLKEKLYYEKLTKEELLVREKSKKLYRRKTFLVKNKWYFVKGQPLGRYRGTEMAKK